MKTRYYIIFLYFLSIFISNLSIYCMKESEKKSIKSEWKKIKILIGSLNKPQPQIIFSGDMAMLVDTRKIAPIEKVSPFKPGKALQKQPNS